MSYDCVFVIGDLMGGGAQKVLLSVANQLARRNKKICIITMSESHTDYFSISENIERRVIGGIGKSNDVISAIYSNVLRIIRIRKELKRLKTKNVVGFVFSTNILVVLATRYLNIKVIISERNDPSRQSGGVIWDALRKSLYKYADVVTANSASAIDAMRGYVPPHKLILVNNPISLTESEQTISLSKPTLLAVGRLYDQKAYDVLLKAFHIFMKFNKNWDLIILGDGPLKDQLIEMANVLNISNNVSFMGYVKDTHAYYSAAEIFVMPSRHEGMPNALLEALSCKMPVVVSDTSGGALEYIEHNISGLVVRSEDENELAKELLRLSEDESLRKRLSAEGYARVSKCKLDNVINEWSNLLEC